MTHESWIDAQIREAAERGEFDNLPGAGKPIKGLAKSDPDWWIKDKLRREGIEAPPSEVEILRDEVANLEQTLRSLSDEQEVRTVLVDLNKRIRSARMRRGAIPNRLVAMVDVEAAVQRWRGRGC